MRENATRKSSYREILDSVQPHATTALILGIVAAVSAAATSYSSAQAAKAGRRAKRGAMNAAATANSAVDTPTTPTAKRFGEDMPSIPQGKSLADIVGAIKPEMPQGQSVASAVDKLPTVPDPQPQGFEDKPAAPVTDVNPVVDWKAPEQKPAQPDTAGQVGGYAQTAAQLYQLYLQSRGNGPTPSPIPQLGQMNLTPTAGRFGR